MGAFGNVQCSTKYWPKEGQHGWWVLLFCFLVCACVCVFTELNHQKISFRWCLIPFSSSACGLVLIFMTDQSFSCCSPNTWFWKSNWCMWQCCSFDLLTFLNSFWSILRPSSVALSDLKEQSWSLYAPRNLMLWEIPSPELYCGVRGYEMTTQSERPSGRILRASRPVWDCRGEGFTACWHPWR